MLVARLTCSQGGQAPTQHFLLQACRWQSRVSLHLSSQVKVLAHWTSFTLAPHLHFLLFICRQEGQWPR